MSNVDSDARILVEFMRPKPTIAPYTLIQASDFKDDVYDYSMTQNSLSFKVRGPKKNVWDMEDFLCIYNINFTVRGNKFTVKVESADVIDTADNSLTDSEAVRMRKESDVKEKRNKQPKGILVGYHSRIRKFKRQNRRDYDPKQ